MALPFSNLWSTRPQLFNNPVIKREVVELLRKRGSFGYLLFYMILCLIFILNYWSQYRNNPWMLSYASREQFFFFMFMQGLFILFLVPLLSAGRINLEYEQETWELLRTTHISQASILLGKLLSAVLYIWMLLVAFIPFFGILIIMGGLSPQEIAIGLLVITEVVLLVGLFGLACSAWNKRVVQSISACYFITVFYFFVLPFIPTIIRGLLSNYQNYSPGFNFASQLFYSFSPAILLSQYVFGNFGSGINPISIMWSHALFTLTTATLALLACRNGIRHRSGETFWARAIREVKPDNPIVQKPTRYLNFRDWNPIGVKDWRLLNGKYRWMPLVHCVVFFCLGVFLLLIHPIELTRWRSEIHIWTIFLTPFIIVPLSVYSFRHEMDHNSWELLRTTTVSARSMLLGKLVSCYGAFLIRFYSFYGIIFLMGLLIIPAMNGNQVGYNFTVGKHFLLLWIALFLNLIWGFFYMCCGFLFSITSQKTTTAYVKTILVPLGLIIAPYFFLILITLPQPSRDILIVGSFFSPLILAFQFEMKSPELFASAFVQGGWMLFASYLVLYRVFGVLREEE